MVNALYSQVWKRVHGQPQERRSFEPASSFQPIRVPSATEEPSEPHANFNMPVEAGIQETTSHADTAFMTGGPSWMGSVTDLDIFSSEMDLAGSDWEAIALTLDLPSY